MGVNEPEPASSPGSGAPSANVVIELLAGVVAKLFVRRSVLWKQMTPLAFPVRNFSMSGQPGAANAVDAQSALTPRAINPRAMIRCIVNLLVENARRGFLAP